VPAPRALGEVGKAVPTNKTPRKPGNLNPCCVVTLCVTLARIVMGTALATVTKRMVVSDDCSYMTIGATRQPSTITRSVERFEATP
jgi:hypothetical protein